ncbi:MAG: cofC [Rhodospirillales bacterium]|nr:cofC [Rhodospirillales bacterium]
MSIWAIIPARPLEEGKSRLADALTAAERQRLNQNFFQQTLRVAAAVVGRDHTLVVSRSETLLATARAMEFETLAETAPYGLNAALTQAAEVVRLHGATTVLSVSCDLPFLIPDDLRALLNAARESQGLAIASDREGTGTNALVMSPVGAIPYLYGLGSFAAHQAAARAAGLALSVVRKAGLSFDIDTPDDFEQMEDIKRETIPRLAASSGCAFP